MSCLCYQSFCHEKLRPVLEAITVAHVNWNAKIGYLKVHILKQHYQKDHVPKTKLAALKVQHIVWAAQHGVPYEKILEIL